MVGLFYFTCVQGGSTYLPHLGTIGETWEPNRIMRKIFHFIYVHIPDENVSLMEQAQKWQD